MAAVPQSNIRPMVSPAFFYGITHPLLNIGRIFRPLLSFGEQGKAYKESRKENINSNILTYIATFCHSTLYGRLFAYLSSN